MTTGEYVDYVFGMATGWLGWTPEVAWTTPVPQIYLAIDAKVDWTMQTNPFGSSKTKKEKADVASKLDAAFDRIDKNRARRRK